MKISIDIHNYSTRKYSDLLRLIEEKEIPYLDFDDAVFGEVGFMMLSQIYNIKNKYND